ncbi:conserved hypothetical protein [Ricinus communis]|uniref:Uncharacterized protein n=1 Tax=Ricinus communis TaxID=3988 RepID=B9SG81_RICCO|nr:conserved hypothetical protein [Ricinus communis]
MAGNMRYESASPEELGFTGSYPNGQRGNYSTVSMERSGSFREGSESRAFGSGASTPRASASSDAASLTHYLLLDPITMVDPKYTRSGEFRRVLGISYGNATEDNSFGAAHSKLPPPVATEELNRFKKSVSDATLKARVRIKKLNESLLKLNKFCEAMNLKKQHRSEMLMSERSGVSNLTKMGIQIHRNASDPGTQRLEDRTKNIVMNKRVRSSVAELRADGRSNTLPRQPVVMGKDRDMHRDGSEGSDLPEEKFRRVPAGGEGWERKMKRKRSVGSVFARSTESDGEVKRVIHHKFSNEPGLQSYDCQGFSTGSFHGTAGVNKLDGSLSPASSNPRFIPKNEPDKVSLTRDYTDGLNKERLLAKANNKLNINNDNNVAGSSPMTKGKASRAPRTGSVMAANSSPNFSRTSGPPDGWEQTPSINKVNSFGGTNNRKRSMPAGSSSPPMAQWVGQRPQKFSRTRRVNVMSPVSNHDEVQMFSEGGQPSDFAARLTSTGSNGSLLAKDVANGNQLVKVKYENVSSPASRLSESEESGAGANHEGRPKEKGTSSGGVEERSQNQNVGPSVVLMKKNKMLNKEDTGDGLRRQGRAARGASSSRTSISPVREKLESPGSAKPVRNTKPVPDKSGSKSGRPPLKKISDRKSFTRGKTAAGGSPDCTGESDDDREELIAAANFACNASYLSCSSSFWKKIEPVFASVCLEDLSYLKQQSQPFEESEKSLQDHIWPKKKTSRDLADQGLNNGPSAGIMEARNQDTPLYQRVLSALIVEDESEEFEENIGGRNLCFQNSRYMSPGDTCLPIDYEPADNHAIEFDYDSVLDFQTQKQSSTDGFSCNGNAPTDGVTGCHSQLYNDELFQGGQGFMPSEIAMFPVQSGDNDGRLAVQIKASGISALDGRYQQLCLEEKLLMELQSIGLYPESVPDLADGDDEAISQDVNELQKELHQQINKRKAHLNKIFEAVQEGKKLEGGALEQVAVDRLVELAYKKLLATRGSCASKFGVPKVSKQVALAFMKRTLARCRKFEETAKSCYSEPPLRDIILAAPARGNLAESTSCIGSAVKLNVHHGTPDSQYDPGASGAFPSGAERYDLLNDKCGRVATAAIGTLTHTHDHEFAKTRPLVNRGKKKELLLDDVGSKASFRTASSLGNTLPAGTKGKRSERERDNTLVRNPVTKAGRASQANVKGDRKTKSKPKQKTAQLSTSDGISNKFKDTSSNKKREGGLNSYGYTSQDSFKESRGTADTTDLQDLSLELGMANDMDNHQDLSNLFNFDEDGLPENDLMGLDLPMDGLEIPMDDLSDLNMLL